MSSAEDGSLKVVLTAVGANVLVTVGKTAGWLLSGSPSMLAESIHSLADVANQCLLWVGIRHGDRGSDRNYPAGRGRARYLWNLISAMGIFFIGFGVTTYHGFHELFAGGEGGEKGGTIALVILLLALVVEGWSFAVAYREVDAQRGGRSWGRLLKETEDPTSLGVLLEDTVAVLGILTALAGLGASVIFGLHVFDAVASIVIGLLLGAMAVFLSQVNGRLLIGHAVAEIEEGRIRAFLESRPEIAAVTSLSTLVIGPDRWRLTAEIELEPAIFVDRTKLEEDAEEIRNGRDPSPVLVETADRMVRLVGRRINLLERAIQERFPEVVLIDLEVE